MSNINLSRPAQQAGRTENRTFDRSFLFSILVLVVVFGIYFGLRGYTAILVNKQAALAEQAAAQVAALHTADGQAVVDFKERSGQVASAVAEKAEGEGMPAEVLSKIESLMVPEVALTTLRYDVAKREVTLVATTAEFRHIGRQMVVLKNDPAFSLVVADEGKRNETNTAIDFTIRAVLK